MDYNRIGGTMTIYEIEQRITELEAQRDLSTQQASILRLLLSEKQQEVTQLQEEITALDWDKTEESLELRELEIVLKYLTI